MRTPKELVGVHTPTAPTFGIGADGYKERTAKRRVGSPEYFDRYFYLHVTSDDVSDRDIRHVIDEVVTEGTGPLSNKLLDELTISSTGNRAVEPAIDKLARFAPTDPTSARRLLPYAARLAAGAPEVGQFGRSRPAAKRWFQETLTAATTSDEPAALLDELLEIAPIDDVAWAVRRLDRSDPDEQRSAATIALQDSMTRRLISYLDDLASRPLTDVSEVSRLLYLWIALNETIETDDTALRQWFGERVERTEWELVDIAALFVRSSRIVGEAFYRLSGFDAQLADDLVGLDTFYDELDPQPSDVDINPFHGPPDALEARRELALAALAHLRQGSAS